MMKMKKVLVLAALSLLAFACDKDDDGNKDKNPVPSSVTLVDNNVLFAADNSFTFSFRVVPADMVMSVNTVSLTASSWEEDSFSGGAAPASTKAEFSIVIPIAGIQKGADPGLWVVRCQPGNGASTIRSMTAMFRVLTYDKNGKLQAETQAPGSVSVSRP